MNSKQRSGNWGSRAGFGNGWAWPTAGTGYTQREITPVGVTAEHWDCLSSWDVTGKLHPSALLNNLSAAFFLQAKSPHPTQALQSRQIPQSPQVTRCQTSKSATGTGALICSHIHNPHPGTSEGTWCWESWQVLWQSLSRVPVATATWDLV